MSGVTKKRGSVLADAIKSRISMRGQALLQWGFNRPVSFPEDSVQMPEDVIDQIIAWRDQADNSNSDAAAIARDRETLTRYSRAVGYLRLPATETAEGTRVAQYARGELLALMRRLQDRVDGVNGGAA